MQKTEVVETFKIHTIKLDAETRELIKKNGLGSADVAYAICLQLQKFGLCPCALASLARQCELRVPAKSE